MSKKSNYSVRTYQDTIKNRPAADAGWLEIFQGTVQNGRFTNQRDAMTFAKLLAKGSGQWVEVFKSLTEIHPHIASFRPDGEMK